MRRAAWSDCNRALPPSDAMRFLSVAGNRLPRTRPPLRPNALAISDAFMASIVLSAKHKGDRGGRLPRVNLEARPRVQWRARRHATAGIYGTGGIVESVTYRIY